MKFYISFGQAHAHAINGQTFDKDCLAEIEAPTRKSAHEAAMRIFEGKFHNVYVNPDMTFFPRGIIKLI